MTKILAGEFEVELFNEDLLNSADNLGKYDLFYLPEGYLYSTQIGIKVYHNEIHLKSALISSTGGGTGIFESSFINEQDRIVICCSDAVFCLAIPDLTLLWSTKADSATCFQIFKLGEDYIVHGELEITRLSRNGAIIWQQSGADIFTRIDSAKDDFLVTESYILATDWDNRQYKFDFDGNIID